MLAITLYLRINFQRKEKKSRRRGREQIKLEIALDFRSKRKKL